MYLLDPTDYKKVIEPIKKVNINSLFARFVVEGKISGSIYVDDVDNPATFYVVHPYGMTLLFGNIGNDAFNNWFCDYALNSSKSRQKYEWMQAWPNDWHLKIQQLLGDKLMRLADNQTGRTDVVEIHGRVNFRFNIDKYNVFRNALPKCENPVVRVDEQIFEGMKGSVVPQFFWKNAGHFLTDGVGFSVLVNGMPASTAYTAYVVDHYYELGIETVEAHRGKGFAQHACAALIDYLIENNYEPVWGCRLENTGSYLLAQKIGFEPVCQLPYYRLGV